MIFSATKCNIIHSGRHNKNSCCRLGKHRWRGRKTWLYLLILGWLWTFKIIVRKEKRDMRASHRRSFQQKLGITWCCKVSFRMITYSPIHRCSRRMNFNMK